MIIDIHRYFLLLILQAVQPFMHIFLIAVKLLLVYFGREGHKAKILFLDPLL